jgi:hypothetical protein
MDVRCLSDSPARHIPFAPTSPSFKIWYSEWSGSFWCLNLHRLSCDTHSIRSIWWNWWNEGLQYPHQDVLLSLTLWSSWWLPYMKILSRVGVLCLAYKTRFGLDDWIYWHLTHTRRVQDPLGLFFLILPCNAICWRVLVLRFLKFQLWLSIISKRKHRCIMCYDLECNSTVLTLVGKWRLNSLPTLNFVWS